jgi:hypothetical protein
MSWLTPAETYALANLLAILAVVWLGERLLEDKDRDERPDQLRT